MELRQLRYLVGVSEAGSLLKASRTLHIAQPALSQQVAALEAELGVVLFIRSSRGMSLTDIGRTFVEHARVVLADVERAKGAVQNTKSEMQGEVVVGLPTTVALVATLPILEGVRLRHPGIRLKLVESHSGYLKEWLQSGRLDLSLLFGASREAWLTQRPLLEEQLCLVSPGSAKPRSPRPATIELKKLVQLPMLLPGKDHGLRRIIDETCARLGVELNVLAEMDSLPNMKKAVERGLAYTILSPGAVAEEVEAGRLEVATITKPHIPRTVVCASSLTRPLAPAAAAVIELVTAQIQELVASRQWPARWIG